MGSGQSGGICKDPLCRERGGGRGREGEERRERGGGKGGEGEGRGEEGEDGG